ncbi:MAG: hypothetical protein E2O39_04260 [Planctomycetota bacterium]|nr:MAG: hypothetical protein E2O39_04260 [Planctomycetota bacterium]
MSTHSSLQYAAHASLLAILASLAACVAPDKLTPLPPDPDYVWQRSGTLHSDVPMWVGTPYTAERLQAIEDWLPTDAAVHSPYWNLEGRLQLSEGRLETVREELEAGGLDDDEVHNQVMVVRYGFERVRNELGATSVQRSRAEAGLADLDALLGLGRAGVQTVALVLIPRAEWHARAAIPANMKRNNRGWKRITVHHSAMSQPAPLRGPLADSIVAVRDIQSSQMSAREYGDIGYHFLIDPSGRTFQGRLLVYQGAHSGGVNNIQNIGICVIGNFEQERPTPAALLALEALIEELRVQYDIPRTEILPHKKWKNTECPGRYLNSWLSSNYRARP